MMILFWLLHKKVKNGFNGYLEQVNIPVLDDLQHTL
jgi:hypothetical protein